MWGTTALEAAGAKLCGRFEVALAAPGQDSLKKWLV
jgi:hypothetical protein